MPVLELCCQVDDVCHAILPQSDQQLRAHSQCVRCRSGQLAMSDITTIAMYVHQMRFRDFKTDYLGYLTRPLPAAFPHAVNYHRFVELLPSTVGPLCASVQACFGRCCDLSFVDSTPLAVCHNRRIPQHCVFRDLAQWGTPSHGWFYGFKVHVVINHHGELLACQPILGKVDGRRPVPKLAERLWGAFSAIQATSSSRSPVNCCEPASSAWSHTSHGIEPTTCSGCMKR